jgi:putative ABC transport system substrate-binding protein
MEVTRRISLVVSLAAAVAFLVLPGCYRQASEAQKTSLSTPDPTKRPGQRTIAILMPVRAQTQATRKALMTELSGDFNVETIPVEADMSTGQLDAMLTNVRPACIVVMDNRTVRLYRELQQSAPERKFPPAVILMTSFLDHVIGTLRDATGIAYEVPAVTGFVAVREVAEKRVQRVGVVHRAIFADLIATQTRLAAVEKLTIVSAQVDDEPSLNDIDDALYSLMHERKVDALWVLNDNLLLDHDALTEIWLPRLRDKPVPVVVGVSALVHPEVHFGTLAVLPDHERLGSQAANMIFDIADNDWKLQERDVELPLSVRTVVDVRQLRHDFGLRPGALEKMDEALE